MTTDHDTDSEPTGVRTASDTLEANGHRPGSVTGSAGPTAADQDPNGSVERANRVVAWAPGVLVFAVCAAILIDNDVSVGEVVSYSAYWVACLLVPGTLVHRALLGRRPFLAEDLAFGAATGIALEIAAWLVLDTIGLFAAVRWWWVVPYVLFLSIPALRRHWRTGFDRPTPLGWSVAMGGLMIVVVTAVAVTGFRGSVVPPTPGPVYVDQWFHLSIVQELMRAGPHEIPQVAGEPLTYHAHSHAHMANASIVSRVAPEVVLLRLWLVPVLGATLGLIGGLARQVSGRVWTGPLAAWLTVGGLAGGYLWVDRSVAATSPIVYNSPSQLLANPVVVAAAAAFVIILRQRGAWGPLAVFTLLTVVGAGAKPTVLPVLGAAAAVGLVARWRLDRHFPKVPALALGVTVAVQAYWLAGSAPKSGGLTVFGTLGSISVFRELVPDAAPALRAVNEGLVLDSLSGVRVWVAAGVTLVWLAATQLVRLVGLAGLWQPSIRRDPVAWFLAGGLLAGWGAFLVLDQSGFGQLYFLSTVIPLGAVLTTWLLVVLLEPACRITRRRVLGLGATAGATAALVIRGVLTGRSSSPEYGALESALAPVALGGMALALGWYMWFRYADRWGVRGYGGAAVVTAIVATTVPAAVGGFAARVGSYTVAGPPADQTSASFAPAGEQEAMLWLRAHSDPDDVIATNGYCRPLDSPNEYCDARSFLVSGVAGRRVVLEGWSYTGEAHERHGEGGRSFAAQPPPWPERFALSQAALATPTAEVVASLRDDFGVRWLVGARRAGPVSDRLDGFSDRVFDNGDVAIFRLTG